MRILFVLLIMIICFLLGTVYGAKQDHDKMIQPSIPPNEEKYEEQIDGSEQLVGEQSITALEIDSETPAFKLATAIETVVTFFFDLVIELLYQLSRLFY